MLFIVFLNFTPIPFGSTLTILPPDLIGTSKLECKSVINTSSLTDRVVSVSINTPPALIFFVKSLKLQFLVSQIAYIEAYFLWCFLLSWGLDCCHFSKPFKSFRDSSSDILEMISDIRLRTSLMPILLSQFVIA